jgi:phosphoglycolate phosphatase-like HAD superfamily hydrolase
MSGEMQKLRALILDFDGVILESNGLKTLAFREVFARYPEHLESMIRFHEEHISEARQAKFEYLARLLGRPGDKDLVADLVADFSRRVLDRTTDCAPVSGAFEFLEEFSPRLPLFLASVNPEADLLTVLDRRDLRRHFARVYGCPPWTKTRAVDSLIDVLGGDRAGLALIGDAPSDLRTAREAGIEFIGRDSGIPFDDPVPPLYPDMKAIADLLRARIAS